MAAVVQKQNGEIKKVKDLETFLTIQKNDWTYTLKCNNCKFCWMWSGTDACRCFRYCPSCGMKIDRGRDRFIERGNKKNGIEN